MEALREKLINVKKHVEGFSSSLKNDNKFSRFNFVTDAKIMKQDLFFEKVFIIYHL